MTSFDLGPVLSLPPVKSGRLLRWGVAAFDTFLVIALVYGGARFSVTGSWTSPRLAAAGLGSVIVVALGFVFAISSDQATRLEVDSTGLRLYSRTGVIMREIVWASLHRSMSLDWTMSTPQQAARGLPARWQLK